MKFKIGLILSSTLICLAATAPHAFADDAEAARLTTLFESYLTDTEGVVSVEANGDDYDVTLDMSALADAAAKDAPAGDAPSFKLTPIEFSMTSQGDGKWEITQDQSITMSAEVKGKMVLEEKVESLKATGIFDEKLNYFSKLTGEATGISVSEKVTDPTAGTTDFSVSLKTMKIDQSGTPAANGGVDVVGKYTFDGLNENINTLGKPESGIPPMNIVIAAAGGNYDVTGKGLKAGSIFDLLAFFVAHQSKEEITKNQAELKSSLTSGMPLWENMSANMKINTITVSSQFGQVGMDSMDIVVDANGIVKDGKFREKVAVTGLTLPPALIPPWAAKLVPKNVGLDFTVSGFDLASPAQLLLTQLDLAKDPPIPEGFEQVLMPVFMPKGSVDVIFNPTNIDNETYNVKVEGSMTAGPGAMPSGKATISMKGLDEVMKLIQAAPPEAGLQQGAAVVVVAKGMAKTESDGSLSWIVEASPDGKFLVNGIDPAKLQ